MLNVANDLSQKLYATMEKHKEVRNPNKEPLQVFSFMIKKAVLCRSVLHVVN